MLKVKGQKIVNIILVMIMYCFRVFPVRQRKILLTSYFGRYCNDNPLIIANYLQKHYNYDLVWAVESNVKIPSGMRRVDINSLSYLYELATAKIWIDNSRKRNWVRKRGNQYYIQTWHGNLGNKRVEGAAVDKLSSEYISRSKRDAAYTDLMISGSTFFTNLIREYFWYNGEILECGTPRLDIFFNHSLHSKHAIFKKLNLPLDTNIVLYAPTFRENSSNSVYELDSELLLQTLEKTTGTNWVLLVRLHPNIIHKSAYIFQYSDKVIDVSHYPDLYELILVSDIVISDYSSLTFEAGLLKKPVYLFVLDLDSYIAERGFYFEISELPFIVCRSNEEMMMNIVKFDKLIYDRTLEMFYMKLGIYESGRAAATIGEKISSVIGEDLH